MLAPYLDQGPHVSEVGVHGSPMGEILIHPFHQLRETAESQSLCTGNTESRALLHGHRSICTQRVTMPATHTHSSPPHCMHTARGARQGRALEAPQGSPHWVWDPTDPPHALPLLQHWREGQSHPLTIIQDDQERGQQVTHPLHVANLNVLPDVAVKEGRKAMSPLPMARTKPLPHATAPWHVPCLHPCDAGVPYKLPSAHSRGHRGTSDLFIPSRPCPVAPQLACK